MYNLYPLGELVSADTVPEPTVIAPVGEDIKLSVTLGVTVSVMEYEPEETFAVTNVSAALDEIIGAKIDDAKNAAKNPTTKIGTTRENTFQTVLDCLKPTFLCFLLKLPLVKPYDILPPFILHP
ncbi:hypothetical protein IKF94_01175 [Candidatus Saccharibacteria bacterium]|nr:hypothetical protein [Candidatus Saccharibacteria bacterium]